MLLTSLSCRDLNFGQIICPVVEINMSEEQTDVKQEQIAPEQSSDPNGDRSGSPGAGGSNENGSGRDREDVCRDFLKNICNRGSRCKFFHPTDCKQRTEDMINFCIDFQNRGCMRDNCRFVHASREEVERYKHTREVTLPLARMRRSGPPLDGPYEKRSRMEESRVTELERKNAELSKEVETLKRELQREHERYEDLYALFRQQSGAGAAASKPAAASGYGGVGAYGNWNAGGGWQ
ncbi:unnamed protein product [Nippostrongylus brasiliensis]|uniref:C3H1-type domain-containing protein n=1 Tax=Nippostrongylus brasiliensis TaxID=27835 RepID=A0A0N4YCL6_NIPBR|nr:unnamed protein product [Nippostrongylus brasiliensis]